MKSLVNLFIRLNMNWTLAEVRAKWEWAVWILLTTSGKCADFVLHINCWTKNFLHSLQTFTTCKMLNLRDWLEMYQIEGQTFLFLILPPVGIFWHEVTSVLTGGSAHARQHLQHDSNMSPLLLSEPNCTDSYSTVV